MGFTDPVEIHRRAEMLHRAYISISPDEARSRDGRTQAEPQTSAGPAVRAVRAVRSAVCSARSCVMATHTDNRASAFFSDPFRPSIDLLKHASKWEIRGHWSPNLTRCRATPALFEYSRCGIP